jgi:hypothetical protein
MIMTYLSHVIIFTQVMPEAIFLFFSFNGSFWGLQT